MKFLVLYLSALGMVSAQTTTCLCLLDNANSGYTKSCCGVNTDSEIFGNICAMTKGSTKKFGDCCTDGGRRAGYFPSCLVPRPQDK
ncbi:hypothetical protein Cob_v001270 [Colletotrichum orbiculare MAFF 240422]|uniref:Uncharacterized protein n=1 Tax=Colletotrichum orbiculare (strain 104-T / ATCC 96160 / CBS 514.97 / LARS 414 / MAFF 240422) TaxID=1213857 RepID=A0A484GA82_COLOR|nr:hypothetical protein Cob_v001270 [Colletotrichum orbiculare MAFF 240422]